MHAPCWIIRKLKSLCSAYSGPVPQDYLVRYKQHLFVVKETGGSQGPEHSVSETNSAIHGADHYELRNLDETVFLSHIALHYLFSIDD